MDWPTMPVTWRWPEPAPATARTSSPSRAKSAARMEGAIRTAFCMCFDPAGVGLQLLGISEIPASQARPLDVTRRARATPQSAWALSAPAQPAGVEAVQTARRREVAGQAAQVAFRRQRLEIGRAHV